MNRSRRRFPTFFYVVLVALGCAFSAPPAFAQSNDVEHARELFEEGNAAYRDRNWNQAYEKFKESFTLSPTYDCAGNLGDVELILEKPRDAAEHLAYSLRKWPAGQAEARAKTAARLNDAKQKVASVKVSVNVTGADVLVNGQSVGTSPLEGEVFVEPGAITVEARANGKTDKSTIALDKGGSRTVKLTLGDAAPGGNGTEPNGDTGPLNGGAQTTKPPLFPAFIGGGVALLGLGAGVFFLSKAGSAQDDADSISANLPSGNPCASGSPPAPCADLKTANEDVEKNKNLATVGFVTLGVGAAFTAGYLIWRETAAAPKTGAATPTVSIGPRRLSFSLMGSF